MSDNSDCDILGLGSKMKEALSEQIAKTIAMDVGNKYSDYNCSRRSNKLKIDSHRKGPVPIEECLLTKTTQAATYGTLDSECEELDFEDIRIKNANSTAYNKIRLTSNEKGDSIASCRAMIVYFSKLAKAKDEEELIDLNFVENLFDSGADINFPDKHGQTILHEVARGWHPDVAKFVLEQGAEINKADAYGRTPLHLAAAVDYGEMVEYLIENGAELGRETYEERQTAMHYAAKNNATQSLKVMLRLGGRINDRDYKRRTPLFVSAETARTESARFLIEQGAPCGVYDSSGTPLLSLLIEKMPQIAMEAIEQFHLLDRAFRKHYYYLGYLELDPTFLGERIPEAKRDRKEQKARNKAAKKMIKEETGNAKISSPKCYARTPLEVIVQYEQLDLIMHPVFQRLLHVKWNLFGKKGSIKLLSINMFYTLIWTILGILTPRDGSHYYTPITEMWWRVILEGFGVLLTIYFIVSEITQVRSGEKSHNYWRHWRTQNMEKDLKFCHPRWPEEEKYLRSELAQIRSYQRTYFRDPWNIFEWITYVVVLTLILTRILTVASNNDTAQSIHPRVYALGLVVIWLRFMRSCRAFRTLGPFIAILGSVIADTLKFAFLFFEFFIPYTVGFWILFGGRSNGQKMGGSNINWENFNDLTFSVWSMTLMGSFDWDGLVAIDRLMAQILCGTYFALAGVVCMNLYIALLSDTFARVYASAQANAVMQQAKTIIMLENNLGKFHRSVYGHYMQDHCCPQMAKDDEINNSGSEEVYTREDTSSSHEDHEQDMLDRVCRQITNRIDELDDSLKRRKSNFDFNIPSPRPKYQDFDSVSIENFIEDQKVQNKEIKHEIYDLKSVLIDIKWLLSNSRSRDTLGNPTFNDDMPQQKSATLPSRNKRDRMAKKMSLISRQQSMMDLHDSPKSIPSPTKGGLDSPIKTIDPNEVQRGIEDMKYLQQRLEEFQDTQDFERNLNKGNGNGPALYPSLPTDVNGRLSGKATPKRRRRRRKKEGSDTDIPLLAANEDSIGFMINRDRDETSDASNFDQPV